MENLIFVQPPPGTCPIVIVVDQQTERRVAHRVTEILQSMDMDNLARRICDAVGAKTTVDGIRRELEGTLRPSSARISPDAKMALGPKPRDIVVPHPCGPAKLDATYALDAVALDTAKVVTDMLLRSGDVAAATTTATTSEAPHNGGGRRWSWWVPLLLASQGLRCVHKCTGAQEARAVVLLLVAVVVVVGTKSTTTPLR